MTSLAERLARRISAGGPITVAEYMAAALADPRQGYYRTASPIGAAGDFTTAPEISQMFGELIGAWLIDCWDRSGRPEAVQLIELGPGRGTLMQDALRVSAAVPAWRRAVTLHLIEINPGLRQAQAERLAGYAPRWHESLSTVPDGPSFLVANEFFDALPIRQLVFHAGQWRERLVGWDESLAFHFILSAAPSPLGMLLPPDMKAAPGSVVEVSAASLGLAAEMGRRVVATGGAALIIDYGRAETASGATLRAARAHRGVNVLAEPGMADLSAHVDFAMLRQSARGTGAAVFGPVPQGEFLNTIGLKARAEALRANAPAEGRRAIDDAVQRLAGESMMGDLFKAMAIVSRGIVPSGFQDDGR